MTSIKKLLVLGMCTVVALFLVACGPEDCRDMKLPGGGDIGIVSPNGGGLATDLPDEVPGDAYDIGDNSKDADDDAEPGNPTDSETEE